MSSSLDHDALARVPKGQHTMVAATIHEAFLRPDAQAAHQTWRHVGAGVSRALPSKEPLQKPAAMNVVQCLAGWMVRVGWGNEAVDAGDGGI